MSFLAQGSYAVPSTRYGYNQYTAGLALGSGGPVSSGSILAGVGSFGSNGSYGSNQSIGGGGGGGGLPVSSVSLVNVPVTAGGYHMTNTVKVAPMGIAASASTTNDLARVMSQWGAQVPQGAVPYQTPVVEAVLQTPMSPPVAPLNGSMYAPTIVGTPSLSGVAVVMPQPPPVTTIGAVAQLASQAPYNLASAFRPRVSWSTSHNAAPFVYAGRGGCAGGGCRGGYGTF